MKNITKKIKLSAASGLVVVCAMSLSGLSSATPHLSGFTSASPYSSEFGVAAPASSKSFTHRTKRKNGDQNDTQINATLTWTFIDENGCEQTVVIETGATQTCTESQ